MSQRRGTWWLLACGLGAVVALFAASSTWVVLVQTQPAPLPPVRTSHSGLTQLPWLSALAFVALAGAGALLATRGPVRVAVACVEVLAGLGVAAAGGYGLLTLDGVRPVGPLACLAAGALVAAAGAVAVVGGTQWPSLGSRYERTVAEPVTEPERSVSLRSGPSASDVAMWDALDRGEDPTR